MSSKKVIIIHLKVGFIKKILSYKMIYYPETDNHTKSKMR